VKGDARMAEVINRAVADRERGLRQDLVVGFGSLSLRVAAPTTRAIVSAARRRPGTHNARRRQVEAMVVRALYDQYVPALARTRGSTLAPELIAEDGGDLGLADFGPQIRRAPEVIAALDRMWPLLSPEDLLNDLFGSPALLALAARDVLTDDERDALARTRARTLEEMVWTAADIPLIDEARALLGPLRVRRARGEDDDQPRGYGHIVVDEAQDLSPMALRMLGRRSISGSMTLVGDIGQATTAWTPAGWGDVLRHLPTRRPPRVASLTVNYRTPAEIMEAASEVLSAATADAVAPPRSVRATGQVPVARPVSQEALADEVAAAAAELAQGEGTVAVVAATADIPALAAALDAAGLVWGEPERSGLSAPITLLDVPAVKGLEFDAVVVAEPANIVGEPGGSLRALFVALTRPTRELVAVHARPLPESLVRGLQRARTRPAEVLEPLPDVADGDAGLAV
jgi:superfamily I DNA/RNA helicase